MGVIIIWNFFIILIFFVCTIIIHLEISVHVLTVEDAL